MTVHAPRHGFDPTTDPPPHFAPPRAPQERDGRTPASWVIVRQRDGSAIAETFSPHVAVAVDPARYRAVPILEYLVGLNRPQ